MNANKPVSLTDEQLEQIEARLSEADSWGRTLWHSESCTYSTSDAQFECDCMRSDLVYVIERYVKGRNVQG